MKYPRLYAPSANSSMLRLIPARLEQQTDVPQFEMRLESTLGTIYHTYIMSAVRGGRGSSKSR